MLLRLLEGNKLNNVFVARSNGICRKANWGGLEGSCRNMGAVWPCRGRGRIPRRSVCTLAGAQAGCVLWGGWSWGLGGLQTWLFPEHIVPLPIAGAGTAWSEGTPWTPAGVQP